MNFLPWINTIWHLSWVFDVIINIKQINKTAEI